MRFRAQSDVIADAYEQGEFSRAMREVMALADLANQFVDANKPWEIAKAPERSDELHGVCTACLELFRLLTLYLKPVLPGVAAQVETLLGIPPLTWEALDATLLDQPINDYQHLMTRVEPAQVQGLMQAAAASVAATVAVAPPLPAAATVAKDAPPIADTIGIDDFSRIDLRVARIVKAEAIPEADKLLRLTLDLGFETRQVFAGIKSAYSPEQLEGRLTVMVANLAPRKMRFGESQGQHVNKTSSAVRVKHLPSGVVVVVDDTPSQFRNKALAFERLIGKLRLLNYVAPKRYATRPTRASKERRLEGKRRDAAIKRGRSSRDHD